MCPDCDLINTFSLFVFAIIKMYLVKMRLALKTVPGRVRYPDPLRLVAPHVSSCVAFCCSAFSMPAAVYTVGTNIYIDLTNHTLLATGLQTDRWRSRIPRTSAHCCYLFRAHACNHIKVVYSTLYRFIGWCS